MGLFDRADAPDALEDLLDRERAAILAGDYARLERIVPEKARLIERAAQALRTAPDAPALARLHTKSARNARLLQAAGAGIRAALERLRTLRDPARPLETYGPDGNRLTLGNHSLTMEKKA